MAAVGLPFPPSNESHLYLLEVGGTNIEQLTERPDQYAFPTWSPSGSILAVTVNLNQVWLLDVAAKRFSYLTVGEGAVWSPDGSELAVYVGPLSDPATNDRQIRFFTPDGKSLRAVDVGHADPALRMAPTAPATMTRGTAGPPSVLAAEYLLGLSWSPDGKRIAWAVGVFGNGTPRTEAFLLDVESSRSEAFLPNERVGPLAWAPSGEWIAYVRLGDSVLAGELVIADEKGNCLLVADAPPEVQGLTWSPDSTRVAYLLFGTIHVLDWGTPTQDPGPVRGCP